MRDMFRFLSKDGGNGQVVIYDAVNASESIRRRVHRTFADAGVQPIFIESVLTDDSIIQANVLNVKISSPDYEGWDPEQAARDYLKRIDAKIPQYQTMSREREEDLQWVKMINAGQRMVVNKGVGGMPLPIRSPTLQSPPNGAATPVLGAVSNPAKTLDSTLTDSVREENMVAAASGPGAHAQGSNFGYLGSRIVFFLTNLHVKKRTLYFARAGQSSDRSYKSDASLLPEGREYAQKLAHTIMERRRVQLAEQRASAGSARDAALQNLVVWVSPRQRTVATAEYLKLGGCTVRRRPQLQAINPGVSDTLTMDEIRARYPGEAEKHERDPFLHRFPRAESYHDVAIRLEPVILEIEREKSDLLIIAHESVLRVIYGYFMGIPSQEIPHLKMPRDTLFEVTPASYECRAESIRIPGVPAEEPVERGSQVW